MIRQKIEQLEREFQALAAHPLAPPRFTSAFKLVADILRDLEARDVPEINDTHAANSNGAGPPFHCATCGCVALRACARRNCGYGRGAP